MKQIVLYQAIFYTLLFIVFFILTVTSLSNYGWGFLPIINALIASLDFVRACNLFSVYFQMKNQEK